MEVEALVVEEELANKGSFHSKKRKNENEAVAQAEESKEMDNCKRKKMKIDNKAGGSGGGGEIEKKKPPELDMGIFAELTSVQSETREGASLRLAKELVQIQKAYLDNVSGISSSSELARLDSAKFDYLNGCAPTLQHALRRLIRGIASSRACARQGFALGLASVISAIPAIEVKALLNLIEELLEATSSTKGHELRENLLGRIFAYAAIIRSGKVAEMMRSDTSVAAELCQCILTLAEKESFLREPAVNIIVDLIEKLSQDT